MNLNFSYQKNNDKYLKRSYKMVTCSSILEEIEKLEQLILCGSCPQSKEKYAEQIRELEKKCDKLR